VSEIDPQYLPWQSNLLQRALKLRDNQHLPHAVLIDSASSADMKPLLWHLSMLLLCDAANGLSPCTRCEACRMMQAGTYADFSLVTLEADIKSQKINKNIKIEQIRNLIHEVSLTHQYDRLKIAVIYPAESMSHASANALLKTLEEPASSVLILLATHNRGRVPITLRSRCQAWSLNLPGRAQAREWLETQGLDAGDVDTYLDYAAGDAELALELRHSDYASLVDQFKSRFGLFMRGELSATSLCQELLGFDLSLLRRLVNMSLNAYCYQTSGIDSEANPREGADRIRARQLLDLRQRAQKQLRVEENNLDFQLQLEDVLISLKQILTRRLV